MTFTQEDRDLLMQKGISESQIEEQLSCFKTGFEIACLYRQRHLVFK